MTAYVDSDGNDVPEEEMEFPPDYSSYVYTGWEDDMVLPYPVGTFIAAMLLDCGSFYEVVRGALVIENSPGCLRFVTLAPSVSLIYGEYHERPEGVEYHLTRCDDVVRMPDFVVLPEGAECEVDCE